MFSAKDTISELLNTGITVHSKLAEDVELPLVNLDWGATNRPLTFVETKMKTEYWNMYGNPNSCGTLTGETSKDIIDKTTEILSSNLDINLMTHDIVYGGEGSSFWFDRLARKIHKQLPDAEVVTLQEELHTSFLNPWLETGFKIHRRKDLGWLKKFVTYTPHKLILLITLSSHLTGAQFDTKGLENVLEDIELENRPIVVVDATCYLAHHRTIPCNHYDFLSFSGHKFPGGPGSSACIVVSKKYQGLLDVKGTPNVMGIGRLGLSTRVRSLVMKDAESKGDIDSLLKELAVFFTTTERSQTCFDLHRWDDARQTEPVFSFSIRLKDTGKYIHPHIVSTVMLNAFGLQIRAGSQCADYVLRKEGIWNEIGDLVETDRYKLILQPSICRISLPRYLLTREFIDNLKFSLTDFLYVARYFLPCFSPTPEGWELHPDFYKLQSLSQESKANKTGTGSCNTCKEKRQVILYSETSSDKSKHMTGTEIYGIVHGGILKKLKTLSREPADSISVYKHPFRWFAHHLDEDP